MPASRPKNPAGQRAAASCSVPFEFSAPRLLHCAVPAPWGARKLYNCSATREPPLEHRLSRGRSSTSSGLSVHLMGDSLMYQLLHVARCAVTDPLFRFKSAALHVIPPEPLLTELLTPVLKKGASRMHGAGGEALFVVSFGTWYNWEPSAAALPDNVPACPPTGPNAACGVARPCCPSTRSRSPSTRCSTPSRGASASTGLGCTPSCLT